MSNQSILRITREIRDLQKHADLSLYVACKDIDVRSVRALIIGPPDTPYEFGFFEFQARFGRDYPTKAPSVNAITTNHGRTRFNPNIYAQGKVCLSILGTWRGEPGEEWSAAQSLESILISIQSLMSANPYENEPGFEDARTDYDKNNQEAYVAKIRHETIRISVIERLEGYLGLQPNRDSSSLIAYSNLDTDVEPSFEPFRDLCKRRFMWYYDLYMQTVEQQLVEHKDGKRFEKMPFEGPGNLMDGTFQYSSLKQRLEALRKALDAETESWVAEGRRFVELERGVASNLQRQFEQVKEFYSNHETANLDLSLPENNNPFVWDLTLIGRPNTHVSEGMFRVRIHLNIKFPDVQPRVKFETPIFHHRVTAEGVLCYNCRKPDDMKAHIEAIVASFEEDEPAYDPRQMVNPDASRLFWSKDESEKKQYKRRLRRSMEDSWEYC